jgi:hypothetical protein
MLMVFLRFFGFEVLLAQAACRSDIFLEDRGDSLLIDFK